MLTDSINEEIHAIRRKLAAPFDNDISRIFADIRQREATDGRAYVTLPSRPARPRMAEPTQATETVTGSVSMETSLPPTR